MEKNKSIDNESKSLETIAGDRHIKRCSNITNIVVISLLSLWGLAITADRISDAKEKNLRNYIPELKMLDSAYAAQINALDKTSPRYHVLCDSLTNLYKQNIDAVKATYRENGLLK